MGRRGWLGGHEGSFDRRSHLVVAVLLVVAAAAAGCGPEPGGEPPEAGGDPPTSSAVEPTEEAVAEAADVGGDASPADEARDDAQSGEHAEGGHGPAPSSSSGSFIVAVGEDSVTLTQRISCNVVEDGGEIAAIQLFAAREADPGAPTDVAAGGEFGDVRNDLIIEERVDGEAVHAWRLSSSPGPMTGPWDEMEFDLESGWFQGSGLARDQNRQADDTPVSFDLRCDL